MLTLTSPTPTWAHPLPAPVKLAALCLATALLFHLTTLPALALAAAATAALTLSFGPIFARTALKLLRPLWPFILIVALWHLASHAPTQGAAIILRLLTTVTLANIVTMTTTLTAMIAVITALARPLKPLGLNPKTLALAIALTIRFIPTTLLRLATITEAFRARSPHRPSWRILPPILLATIDDADHVAEALRARGGAG